MNKGKKVIGFYKVTYISHNNIVQKLNLISQYDYVNFYKPLRDKRDDVEEELEWLQKRKHKTDEQRKRIDVLRPILKGLNTEIKETFGGSNIFTTESPLFKSIENNGIMVLPKHQGNESKVKIELLTDRTPIGKLF